MDFARASLAAPDDAEGRAWRDSVTDVITLQAVTFALRDLGQVAAEERSVARERATWLIERHAGHLDEVWRGIEMPPTMLDMLTDARIALERSVYAGAVELIWSDNLPTVVPAFDLPADADWLVVMQPGTIVMTGEPIAWWIGGAGLHLEGALREANDRPRQVYRRIDGAGMIAGDIVQPIDEESPAGLPLLVPLRADGEDLGAFTMDAEEWLDRQRSAMSGDVIAVDDRTPT
jgi:hypothetical protein